MSNIISQAGDFLSGADKLYWILALAGTLIFTIQIILVFFGFGDGDTDVDADGNIEFGEHADSGFGDFHFFSLRTVIAFITFFGWGGVIWGDNGWSGFFAAFGCGLAMMLGTAVMIFYLLKLQQTGTITAQDYIGATGTVYLSIPAGRLESGKITVSVHGSTRELTAVADEDLPKGSSIVVEKQIDSSRFLVKKLT